MQTFNSTEQLATIVKVFLIVNIVADALNIILGVSELLFFPGFATSQTELTASELIYLLPLAGVGLTALVGYIGLAITFLMWLHQSYRNLEAFGVRDLQSTPGWAVGSWFIPFLNLIWPLKAVNEVRHGSDPESLRNGIVVSNNATPLLHGVWWACWVTGSILINITSGMFLRAETQSEMALATKIDLFASLVWIAAAYLLYEIVNTITNWQEEAGAQSRFQKSELTPPSFN